VISISSSGWTGRVHTRVEGPPNAPVLLLLHGFSGSLHWFDLAAPLLSADYRLVRVDLLGHGGTGGPGADAPEQARMVEALLEHLGIDDAIAVGHSFGADVAVELAERSARISRLVIVTQAPDYSDANLPKAGVVMTKPVVSTAIARLVQLLALGFTGVAAARHQRLAVQAMRDVRALSPAMFRVVLVDRKARMSRRPLDAQVRAAGKPTLVILGGRDHFYGARARSRYEAAGAQVIVLPDAGHSPLVETPAETVEHLRAFARRARLTPSE
jgi:pimeloyl-ACP methyl ester carboxylesterase